MMEDTAWLEYDTSVSQATRKNKLDGEARCLRIDRLSVTCYEAIGPISGYAGCQGVLNA